jgi:hypothetical protein
MVVILQRSEKVIELDFSLVETEREREKENMRETTERTREEKNFALARRVFFRSRDDN